MSAEYTITQAEDCSKDNPHILTLSPSFGDGDSNRWPAEDKDMTLLKPTHDKHVLWRKTAGELLAKHLGIFDEHDAPYWILDELPRGYALFQQITHPKADARLNSNKDGKLRLDRFVFGHNGRKIRSALSLGKHISWLINGNREEGCQCDGCKVVSKAVTAIGGGAGVSGRASPGTRMKPGQPSRGRKRAKADSDEDDDEGGWGSTKPKARGRPPGKKGPGVGGKGKQRAPYWISSDEEDDSELGIVSADGKSIDNAPTAPPVDPKTDIFALEMRPAGVQLPINEIAPEQRTDDFEVPAFSRVGELVWCKVPITIAKLEPKGVGLAEQKITHWPGIVVGRDLIMSKKAKAGIAGAYFAVQFLGLCEEETLWKIPNTDVIPWLGFLPYPIDVKQSEEIVKLAGPTAGERKMVAELAAGGFDQLKVAFLAARRIGECYAKIQVRSTPSIKTGRHRVPNPDALPDATPLGSLYSSHPTTRYLSHSFVYFGPELLYAGDILRLVPEVELPPDVAKEVVALTPHQLGTCLILQSTAFYRGQARDAPLMVRGKVYEMNEVGKLDDDPSDDEDSSDDDGTGEVVTDNVTISRKLPAPFPGHRWRCLTPGRSVDLFADQVAGRYFSLGKEAVDDDNVVNVVADRARRNGTQGEVGIKAMGLLLAGMVSGAKGMPRNSPEFGVRGGQELHLPVAEQKGYVLAGLRLDLSPVLAAQLPLDDINPHLGPAVVPSVLAPAVPDAYAEEDQLEDDVDVPMATIAPAVLPPAPIVG